MKYLIFSFLLFSQFAQANYSVGRALTNQDAACGVLLYTALADVAQNHPIKNMPKIIQIFENNKKINFYIQGWHRSFKNIETVFLSDSGELLTHDDACKDGSRVVSCLHYQGCDFRALSL